MHIHPISKSVPQVVRDWFKNQYHDTPHNAYTFKFYWYAGMKGKTYGAKVYCNGELYSYAVQGALGWFTRARRAQLKSNALCAK